MPNEQQPQGVTKVLDVTTLPSTGFFSNEFIEDKQTVLPNVIHITGANAEVPLVINDGLLRTHSDVMTLHVAPTADQTLKIIFPKAMFDVLATAEAEPSTYIAHQHTVVVPANEKWVIDVRKQASDYHISHCTLDNNTGM